MAGRWRVGGLCALAVTLSGCAPKGEDYASTEGRFRVAFPGRPAVEPLNDPSRPAAKKVTLTTRHGALAVAWEDVPAKDHLSDDQRLDNACSAALVEAGGKARRRKKVPLVGNGAPGRELLVETGGGKLVMEVRFYLVKGRLYRLTAAGPAWWIESAEARAFFRSFEVRE